jgi:hypothetical protein
MEQFQWHRSLDDLKIDIDLALGQVGDLVPDGIQYRPKGVESFLVRYENQGGRFRATGEVAVTKRRRKKNEE